MYLVILQLIKTVKAKIGMRSDAECFSLYEIGPSGTVCISHNFTAHIGTCPLCQVFRFYSMIFLFYRETHGS